MATYLFARGIRLRQPLSPACSCSCRHASARHLSGSSSRRYASAAAGSDFSEGSTHYEVLALRPDASKAQVKAAFYALSKRHHPDVSPTSGRLFQRINAAYAVLRDDRQRREYDRSISLHSVGGDASGGSTGGGLRPSGLSRRKTRPQGPPPSWGASFSSANQADRPYASTGSASSSSSSGGSSGGFAGFGERPPDPGRDSVHNAHFSYAEHRSRHARFDARWAERFAAADDLARREGHFGSPSSGGAMPHRARAYPHSSARPGGPGGGGGVGDGAGSDGGTRFFMALGLFSVIVLVSGLGASVRADDGSASRPRPRWSGAGNGVGSGGLRSTDTTGPLAFRKEVERIDWHGAMRDAAGRDDRSRALSVFAAAGRCKPGERASTASDGEAD